MTFVLDSGGLSALVANKARLRELRARGHWPPLVPTVVLTESLTGDHRRDHGVNRFLRRCTVVSATEIVARHAAALRYTCTRKDVSAVDAIVAATADHAGGGIGLTSDPDDLNALACGAVHELRVAAV